jgi:hypothetical protein
MANIEVTQTAGGHFLVLKAMVLFELTTGGRASFCRRDLPGLAHLIQLLADILLNGSGILMQGFQEFLGEDVAVLLQNQNSGASKGILGMTDKQSRSTSKRVLSLVFALVRLSLLVDSFTSSAVVHTVAPTSVVVVAKKCCCHADNEWSDERTKATSSYVDLVG